MKIILMIVSAIAAACSAFVTFFVFMMLHGGGLGRSTPEEVMLYASYTLLNLVVLVSLMTGGARWKPAYYILGLIDCIYGAQLLLTLFINSGSLLLGLIAYAKGALALSYASRMETTQPT